MDKRAIAEAFSTGNFGPALPYLTEQTVWSTPGEQHLTGKQAIEAFCHKIAAYFAGMTTDFRPLSIIEDDSGVAINGTAEFIRDGRRVSRASSCDVYRFDGANRILSIHSYCITERENLPT